MAPETIVELFDRKRSEGDFVKISAPMVRYSKLSFRRLVRKYGADVAFTPMIMADSFVASEKSRDIEFTTAPSDRPLIVQFAANTVWFSCLNFDGSPTNVRPTLAEPLCPELCSLCPTPAAAFRTTYNPILSIGLHSFWLITLALFSWCPDQLNLFHFMTTMEFTTTMVSHESK